MNKVISTEAWDPSFFNDFRERYFAFRQVPLQEKNSDFERMFGENAPFSNSYQWSAWMIYSNHHQPLGRIIASIPKSNHERKFVSWGYFESIDDAKISAQLFTLAKEWALWQGCAQPLRGPVQGHFFNGYRIKMPGGGKPFFGEPVYPDYYHKLFRDQGFKPCGYWKTVRVTRRPMTQHMFSLVRMLKKKNPKTSELKIRTLNLKRWDEEIRLIHRLFMESYANMPDFTPIGFDEFQSIYSSFKYFANPRLIYFVESGEEVKGFFISYFDPLPILLGLQKWAPKLGAQLAGSVALIRLKFNFFGRLLVMYVGKTEKAGESIKGVTALMTRRFILETLRYGAREALICYLAGGSPAYKSLPENLEVYSEYLLYEEGHLE